MLQQTQTHRVAPKYDAFLQRFPTITDLAQAPLADVLFMWQGLGYNRRAKSLHAACKEIIENHNGIFPQTPDELLLLPGIGPYTSGAIFTFAFNQPANFYRNKHTCSFYTFLLSK